MAEIKQRNEVSGGENMKNYVDNYIYDVVRRLPKEQRDDVSLELRTLIEDMLEDGSDIEAVLKQLGRPSELAEKYRERPRYLISPDQFDSYIETLKKVVPIAAIVGVVFGVIQEVVGHFLQNPGVINTFTDVSKVIGKTFGSSVGLGISLMFQAVVWTTVAFVVIDYTQYKKKSKEWSIDELPQMPNEKLKSISRSETIVGIVFSIIFTVVIITSLYFAFPSLINISNTSVVILFNNEYLVTFVPMILVLFALSLIVAAMKLIYGYWNFPIAHVNFLYNIAMLIGLGYFVSGSVFTPESMEYLSSIVPSNVPIETIVTASKYGFFMVTLVIVVIDIALAYYRAYKNNEVRNLV